MADFCLHCGASFPHRFGEGRCQHCLPRAFRELETAHSEKVYTQAELDAAIREAGFATEPHRQLIDRAKHIIEYYSYGGYNNRSIQAWLSDAEKAIAEPKEPNA